MASPQEQAQAVAWFIELKYATHVYKGYVKNTVHQSSVTETDEMKSRISVVNQIVDPVRLHRRWLKILSGFDVLRANNGAI
ncbi:hypothetical protein TNCV_2500931 [Trichonephila clavipes]|nr:hypothetical protein TNCV_2500931 [Trichonephila clavipes]